MRRTRSKPILTKEECREIEQSKAERCEGEERAGRMLRIAGYLIVALAAIGGLIIVLALAL
jgi:hypothetical protein